MASGSISATTNNEYIVGSIAWSSVSNQAGNYSDVTATLTLWRTNGYTTYGSGSWTISINGTSKTVPKTVTIDEDHHETIISNTVRVAHNANGTKSIAISATGGINGTSYETTNASGTAVLDTIPRNFYINVGDQWHNVNIEASRIKTSDGTWHAIDSMYIRVGTGWEQIF